MGRAVPEEKMSDGEIRYRFQTIDRRFEEVDRRFEHNEQRSNVTWGKVAAVATMVVTLLAALIGAWITTKGIK